MEIQTMEIQESFPAAPQKVDFLTKIIQNDKNNPLFTEAATILSVINESIESELKIKPDMPGYDTALFGALLKNIRICINKDNYERMPSYVMLFQYVLQKVNPSIRQQSGAVIEKSIEDIFQNAPKNTIPQKYIISMYYNVLQFKPPAEWKKESTKKMFNYILESLESEKMNIRKKASKCLTSLVEHGLFKIPGMDFGLQNHFLQYVKDSYVNPKQTVYALYFLNGALKHFPVRVASEIAHNLVALLKNDEISHELATHIYSAIENLLTSKPLQSSLVEGFLKDLLNHPPVVVEKSNVNLAYIQCLTQAVLHLYTVDPKASQSHIAASISACTEYLTSSDSKLAGLASQSVELIISHTVNKSLWIFSNNEETLESVLGLDDLGLEGKDAQGPNTFERIIVALKYLLTPQFDFAQKYVSNILTTFFEQLDNTCPEGAYELLLTWIEKRGQKPHHVWEPVIGKFIQKINLEFVLKTFPLYILEADLSSPSYERDSNSWLLPILRKYLHIDSIQFFLEYFLPIVAKLDDYIYSKRPTEFTEVEKTLELAYIQIWVIFPKFCKFTRENVPFIEQIFEITTAAITNRDSVRSHVCQGLDILCTYFLKLPKYSNAELIQAQEKLTTCSTKLMPKLCSMFMKDVVEAKAIIRLIRTMAGLCDKTFLETVFLKHIRKLVEEKLKNKPYTMSHTRECDILIAMAGSIDMAKHYDISKQFIKCFLTERKGFQKRAFKLLDVLAHKVHSSFLTELFGILEDAKLIQSSSRFGKLSCILTILSKMEYNQENMEEVLHIVQKLLPEILLALKETNRKTRKVANDIIGFLTKKFQSFDAAPLFTSLITAGLAAKTSLMKSVAISGIAQVMKVSGSSFDVDFIWETTSIVLLMIKEKNREIFRAVLRYLKSYIKITSKHELQKNLQSLLIPLFEWDEDGREQSKLMLRYIIEKLVRKIGKNEVEAAMPAEHKKLVKYITKQEKVNKKKKEEKRAMDRLRADEIAQERQKKNKENADIDEEEDYERAQFREAPVRMGDMETENIENNNLLLKFDNLQEKFHFVEHPFAKIKEKKQKEAEILKKSDNDVIFNEQTGKIYVTEDITGKKRKGDARFGEDILMEEEPSRDQQPRVVRKVVRVSHDKTVPKQLTQEEQKAAEEPQRRKSVINKKIIADVKIFNSETLNPTAYIPINPKILNKRNRANASKAFEFLISKKKTGSLAGLKSKVKS